MNIKNKIIICAIVLGDWSVIIVVYKMYLCPNKPMANIVLTTLENLGHFDM